MANKAGAGGTKTASGARGRAAGPAAGATEWRLAAHPVKVVVSVNLTALAYPDPDGGYSVRVPALPGCFTEADDIEQVQRMVIEAAEGWLAVKHDMEMERSS